jgi:surface polysaccharide O-acyltransferase-like enzyme
LPISLVMAGFAHRPIPLSQPLHAFVYFLPAYLAGMATGRFHSRMAPPVQWLGQSWLRWSLTVLAVTFVPLEVWVLGRGGALWSAKFFGGSLEFDTNLPFKLVLSLATLSWLAIAPKGINRRLFLLAELSFGIFFIHEYVLQAFCRISGGELPGSLLHVMAGTVSVTVTSLGVVVSTKRLTGKWSRYLVGC